MRLVQGLIIAVFFVYSAPAYAYLDPSTGSALIYALIALVTSAFYTLKSIIYRIWPTTENIGVAAPNCGYPVIVLSEGAQYRDTYIGILDALCDKNIEYLYITLDLADPILADERYSAKYIPLNYLVNYRLGKYRSTLFVSSTPNIGTAGYPISRPKHAKKMVHISHAIADFSYYAKGALDQYDTVLMPGEFALPSVRLVEAARGLKKKMCVSTGVPYIDVMCRERDALPNLACGSNKTVMVAPSWGAKCFVNYAGIGFVDELIRIGYKIIFRPHPQSARLGEKYLTALQKKFSGSTELVFDYSPSPVRSMAISSVLISDLSGIRLDYVVLFKRSVMTVLLEKEHISQIKDAYEIDITGTAWEETINKEIGLTINCSELNTPGTLTERLDCMDPIGPRLQCFIDQYYPYYTKANDNVAKWVEGELKNG